MFGLLRPCAHGAAKYGVAAGEFVTQMCGLCLGLRDGHSQVARAATNTDAIVLSILTEAQRPESAARETAGPCPLRGMRKATVVTAAAPGVRLAATASLLLGAAKIRDHVDDGEAGVLRARPMARVAAGWFTRARVGARDIGLDIEPLIAAIDAQSNIERTLTDSDRMTSRRAATLDTLTRATQVCTAELFAHTAILAGRPENAPALRDAGWHFGRIAHLADAIEDREQDRRRGRFNPLTATGTTRKQAYALLRESNSRIEEALWRAGLADAPIVRWALLDPVAGVVRRMRRTAAACSDAAHTCSHNHCGTSHEHSTISASTDPARTVRLLGFPTAPRLIELSGRIGSNPYGPRSGTKLHGPGPRPGANTYGPGMSAPNQPHPFEPRPGTSPREPGPSGPRTPYGPGPGLPGPLGPRPGMPSVPNTPRPYDIPTPFSDRPDNAPRHDRSAPGPPPPERPGCGTGLAIVCGAYCTGYACCATHRRPCSGVERDPWFKRVDCWESCCDGCCDGCDGCGDCQGCSDCCSCDCCPCDGCGDCGS